MKWLFAIMVSAISLAAMGADYTRLKSDERIVFFPAIAQQIRGTNVWRAELRGCVFEPERRGIWMGALREALDLKNVSMTAEEENILRERARLFLVDHERRKAIFIRLDGKTISVGKSRSDGRFAGKIELKRTGPEAGAPFAVALAPDDAGIFSGEIFFVADEGVSVISDIDDTIKITEVHDRNATLRNTFLREFRPVPGMAEFYQRLARERGAAFHYISASPWQLYEPLADFVRSNGFPAGTFELKEFRWKNRTFLSLFADPEKYKPTVIEPLLKKFPKRRFMLIGDSGERDPEIYGALARKFPDQIEHIYIRDVTNEMPDAPRYATAFRDLRREVWTIFRDPAEISATASR